MLIQGSQTVKDFPMKYNLIILLLTATLLFSCDPFHPGRVEEKQDVLIEIYNLALADSLIIVNRDDTVNAAGLLRKYGITRMKIEYGQSESIIGADSIVTFVKTSSNIFVPEKRILYDIAYKPRNFRSEKLVNASYERVQINDRWYFESEGFD